MHQIIFEILGISIVSYDAVKVQFQKFKAEKLNIEGEPHSCRSVKVNCKHLKDFFIKIDIFQDKILRQSCKFEKKMVNALKSLNLTFNCNSCVPY